MSCYKKTIVICLIICFTFVPHIAIASVDWMTRAGTISHALSQRDGTRIYLDAVRVSKIRREQSHPYFVIQETFSQKDRIIVSTAPPIQLRHGQIIDIEGIISTLSDGKRSLEAVKIIGYFDKDGNLLYNTPRFKGLYQPTQWEWKADLQPSNNTQSQNVNSVQPMAPPVPGEPNTTNEAIAGPFEDIVPVRSLDDNTFVTLLSMGIASVGTGFFYLQDSHGDSIKVYYTYPISSTNRVASISATLFSEAGSKVLCVDGGPIGYISGDHPTGSITTTSPGSITHLFTLPNGATCNIAQKIVTADSTDFSGNILYVEEPNRSAAICVLYNGITQALKGNVSANVKGTHFNRF